MVSAKLDALPDVDIDEGNFKYILVKVSAKENPNDTEQSKLIVRGYKNFQWHADVMDKVDASCQELGLQTECLGGGRIEHNSNEKFIKIYDYSQAFGRADHSVSKSIIQTAYPDYTIQTL